MAIKRRVVVEQTTDRGMLRHPLLSLGSTTLLAYNFIKANPGATRGDMRHFLPSGQPLTDLFQEGLIRPLNNKRPRQYVVVPENETGKARDKVEVEVTVFVNRYGEYSIEAKMLGQKIRAHEDFPVKVTSKTLIIPVPYPDEPFAERPIIDVNDRIEPKEDTVNTHSSAEPLIIDVDYTTITSS